MSSENRQKKYMRRLEASNYSRPRDDHYLDAWREGKRRRYLTFRASAVEYASVQTSSLAVRYAVGCANISKAQKVGIFVIQERSAKKRLRGGRGWLVAIAVAAGVDARRSCSCQHGKGSKFENGELHVDGGMLM